jgi:hypothetical protein
VDRGVKSSLLEGLYDYGPGELAGSCMTSDIGKGVDWSRRNKQKRV